MNCFTHPHHPAVGVCKACGRGLCPACAAEVGESLACRGRHKGMVEDLDRLAMRGMLQAGRARSAYLRNAVFYALAGTAFAAFGALQLRWLGWQAWLLLLLGSFLFYAALANFLESRKHK
jgi:asparagine N-glycosylation enzyme membrane subunit Stt3